MISTWLTYLKERSPLPALAFIAAAIAIPPLAILETFDMKVLVLSLIFNVLIFIQMRLGDEIKDFDKDKIIHPERPLPRGLLTIPQVTNALYLVLGVNIVAGLALYASGATMAGCLLGLTTIFAWLMYKEFFIGGSLAKEPMTYALTHQIIVFPLYAWPALFFDVGLKDNTIFQGWLLANFGASFTFEICRKLDPNAHKLAGTYAHHYGRTITVLFIGIFLAASLYGSNMMGLLHITTPMILILFLSLLYYLKNPAKYKICEGLSVLSSIMITWSPSIAWMIKVWRS